MNELTLPERAAVALGAAEHEKKLASLVAESKAITAIKNADARTQCHAAMMTLKNARVAIEKTGKAAREDAQAFSKAIIAEEKRLIGITQAEEDRLQALRDKWDADIEAERQAKLAIERKRIEEIRARITAIRNIPAGAVGKSSDEIGAMIAELSNTVPDASFQEFEDEAKLGRFEALDQLAKMEAAQRDAEARAEAALQEAVRLRAEQEQESARLKAEREELARLRAESDRLRKLEDEKRQHELQQQREEMERQNEALRLERVKLARAQAEIDAAKVAAEDERARLQEIADRHLADNAPVVADVAPIAAVPMPIKPVSSRPTDAQIIDAVSDRFDVPRTIVIAWLRDMDFSQLAAA